MDTEGHNGKELCVVVVDENPFHARATKGTLAKLNFKAMVYTSPVQALNFLKHHDQDVDFIMVDVHMKEMHGFQFLDISREMHKNLQVIMMSTEVIWPVMQRCVELGARFMVKKPLDTNAISNVWQYLDQKHLRMEKIKNLFKGIQGSTYDINFSDKQGFEKTLHMRGGGTRKKTSRLIWSPFLQNKFLHAVELLGDAATPKKIATLMNVSSIDCKQISTHLQKHKKRMEKEQNSSMDSTKYSRNASSIEPLKAYEAAPMNNEIQTEDTIVEETSNDHTLIIKETMGDNVYEAMRKALRLGTVFDEQLSIDPEDEEENYGDKYMMEDDISEDNYTSAFGQASLVPGIYNAYNVKEIINKFNYVQTTVVKLVAYSDSEDDEEVMVNA